MSDYERCDMCGASDRPTEHYRAGGHDRVACVDERACYSTYHRLTREQRLEVQDYRYGRRLAKRRGAL